MNQYIIETLEKLMAYFTKQTKSDHIFTKICIAALLLLIWQVPPLSAAKIFQENQQSYIPDSLISLSSGNAIVVDKTTQKLFVFNCNKGRLSLVYESQCSTGKNKGMKMISGDAKTPEGIYYATKFYNDNELSSIYGIMAFRLDYPNFVDRKNERDGNNIWLHGTNKTLHSFQSNGCVALTNKDIKKISRYIRLYRTPVIIQNYTKWVPQNVRLSLKNELDNILDNWTESVIHGNSATLGSLYNKGPAGENTNVQMLEKQINKWKTAGAKVSLWPSDISILKYDGYSVITFDQTLSVNGRTLSGSYRKLFLKKNRTNWHIIGDTLQPPVTETQFIANLQGLDNTIQHHLIITQTINDWLESWKSGDMTRYASFYAPDFRSTGTNLKNWILYKTKLSHLSKNIRISIENVRISSKKKGIMAVFTQRYTSSMHSDVGIKKLYFKKIHDQWKIYRESWKAIKH